MKSDKVELVKARLTATAALGREPPRAAQRSIQVSAIGVLILIPQKADYEVVRCNRQFPAITGHSLLDSL